MITRGAKREPQTTDVKTTAIIGLCMKENNNLQKHILVILNCTHVIVHSTVKLKKKKFTCSELLHFL